ncbi:MAG: hypothetical protein Q9159_001781 [Coniocarpon cinnabarinum]
MSENPPTCATESNSKGDVNVYISHGDMYIKHQEKNEPPRGRGRSRSMTRGGAYPYLTGREVDYAHLIDGPRGSRQRSSSNTNRTSTWIKSQPLGGLAPYPDSTLESTRTRSPSHSRNPRTMRGSDVPLSLPSSSYYAPVFQPKMRKERESVQVSGQGSKARDSRKR